MIISLIEHVNRIGHHIAAAWWSRFWKHQRSYTVSDPEYFRNTKPQLVLLLQMPSTMQIRLHVELREAAKLTFPHCDNDLKSKEIITFSSELSELADSTVFCKWFFIEYKLNLQIFLELLSAIGEQMKGCETDNDLFVLLCACEKNERWQK